MTPEELANYQATLDSSAAIEGAKQQAINAEIPSWSQVETACDNISSLAEAKAFIKKLSRVVYWLTKNSEA